MSSIQKLVGSFKTFITSSYLKIAETENIASSSLLKAYIKTNILKNKF